ncbi:DUF3331 domain-containing protein [Paraburkholderia sp. GAS32]|uniref:DUF3331 domain-containing protein n=1 Tax=Paraburkholderia sp. GAS32 TaxID=3035129 RepID=UPI003D1C0323
MQAPFETDRTWQSTMALLSNESETQAPVVSSCFRPHGSESDFRKCVIRVLERSGRTSATLAWSDATSCCYGEQHWRRCVAKKAGVCALSGLAITRGNAVYRPKRVQPAPRNIEAMILATVLEAVSLEEGF